MREAGRLSVIGITGSNGKTTTKNLLAAILSAHGKALALSYYDDRLWNIQVLDLRDGQTMRHYVAHSRRIAQLAYSPDGSWLVSVGADKFIRAWH